MDVLRPEERSSPSLRTVPLILAGLAVLFLMLAIAAVAIGVRIPPAGDSSGYTCSPFATAVGGGDPSCDQQVRARLSDAAAAGIASGFFGLLAFGTLFAGKNGYGRGEP